MHDSNTIFFYNFNLNTIWNDMSLTVWSLYRRFIIFIYNLIKVKIYKITKYDVIFNELI